MAFPSIANATQYVSDTTNTKTWTVFTDQTVGIGQLLVFILGADGGTIISASEGWTVELQTIHSTSAVSVSVIWKVSTTDSESLTITSSDNEQFTGVLYQIDGGLSVLSASNNGATAGSNPPLLNGGSAKDYLWIAATVTDRRSITTTPPPNYTNFINNTGPASGTGNTSIAAATRQLNAASEDPDPFTGIVAGEEVVSVTIAVVPGVYVDIIPPEITSVSSLVVFGNQALSHTLASNEVVTWSVVGGDEAEQFAISGSTLSWAGAPTRDYQDPQDTSPFNSYLVEVRATDGTGNSTDQTITVNVVDPSDDIPPTITGNSAITAYSGAVLSHQLTADELVTWSIFGGDDSSQFQLLNDQLSWTDNGKQYVEGPSDSDGDNQYVVIVRATDPVGNWNNQTITVTVVESLQELDWRNSVFPSGAGTTTNSNANGRWDSNAALGQPTVAAIAAAEGPGLADNQRIRSVMSKANVTGPTFGFFGKWFSGLPAARPDLFEITIVGKATLPMDLNVALMIGSNVQGQFKAVAIPDTYGNTTLIIPNSPLYGGLTAAQAGASNLGLSISTTDKSGTINNAMFIDHLSMRVGYFVSIETPRRHAVRVTTAYF